ETPHLARAGAPHVELGLVGASQQPKGAFIQELARLGDLEALVHAMEQKHVEVALQLLDLPCERWLGYTEPRGRAAEMAFVNDGAKIAQDA
ncbi:MAG: hypothetical protein NTV97_12300, partial [Alphaproteobacteria bacterium]|nr:hypothetical protein [Alphaproteobacteria bacterium]